MKTFLKKFKNNLDKIFFIIIIALIFSCILKYKGPLYEQAFADLMENEGGYINHPSDPGGETKFGICKKYNPNIDIKNITLDFAKRYYYKNFWLSMYEKINDRRISIKLFNISVNIGKKSLRNLINETLMDTVCYPDSEAINELETIIQKCEEEDNIESWENYVIKHINLVDSDLFLAIFKSKLINFYCNRIYENNNLHIFRHGWIKRAMK